MEIVLLGYNIRQNAGLISRMQPVVQKRLVCYGDYVFLRAKPWEILLWVFGRVLGRILILP